MLSAPKAPWGTLLRGLARAGASYTRELTLAPKALLLQVNPPVAWWDLHRAREAVAAGEDAMQRALPELLVRLNTTTSGTTQTTLQGAP